jgi:nucleoside-diphosphate-sugar epimerase
MKNKKIVITGGSGFIGGEVIAAAEEIGYRIGVLDMKEPAAKVQFEFTDITSKDSVKDSMGRMSNRLGGIDAVIHLAALFNYSAPVEALHKVNVRGTENVISEAIVHGVKRFINLGAVAEYGDSYRGMIREDFELDPNENYGLTKMLAEEAIFRAHKEGHFQAITFRPCMVYGNNTEGTYIDALFKMAEGLIAPTLLEETRNSYIHAIDIGRACVHALETDGVFQNDVENLSDIAYNVGDDDIMSEVEVLRYLTQITPGRSLVLPIMPAALMRGLAAIVEPIEIGLLGKDRSTLAKDMAKHFDGDHMIDNTRFKETGFEYAVPTVKVGFPMVLEYQQRALNR